MIWASSAMLARVHGQWGCASITRVGLSAERDTIDADGQCAATGPTGPAVVSYFNMIRAPKARAAIQVTPSTTVIKMFFREWITIVPGPACRLKQPPFQRSARLGRRSPVSLAHSGYAFR